MDTFKKILDDVDEVDLTPMIDVTFLLLIYFMVTTMIKQPEAELSAILPGKAAPSSNYKKPPPESHIEIEPDGSVRVDGNYMGNALQEFGLPDVVQYLRGEKSKHGEDFIVHVWTDPLAEWQAPLSVINACGGAKIKKLTPNMHRKN